MPVIVSLWDQFGDVVVTKIDLYVDHTARLVTKSPRRRPGLFEPDNEAPLPRGIAARINFTPVSDHGREALL